MPFAAWHKQVIKKVGPVSEKQLYFRSLVFGLLVFAGLYAYTSWLKIPGVLNKSVADASIILICLSMMLSVLCYFWNFVDTKIVYRKHLGLIGFAFAVVHIGLSTPALKSLASPEAWQTGAVWPAATGAAATIIFTIMTLISNRYAAKELGGVWWRAILRTGYLAVLLVFAHVFLLKSARWITWYEGGMKTLPSTSMMVGILMLITIIMRLVLAWSLLLKSKQMDYKKS